jgi:hypothetical protein
MRNTADLTGGEAIIAVRLQSISAVSAVNPFIVNNILMLLIM